MKGGGPGARRHHLGFLEPRNESTKGAGPQRGVDKQQCPHIEELGDRYTRSSGESFFLSLFTLLCLLDVVVVAWKGAHTA